MKRDKKYIIRIDNFLNKEKSFFYIPWNKKIKYSWLIKQIKHIDSDYFKITFDKSKEADIVIEIKENINNNEHILWVKDEKNLSIDKWIININNLDNYFKEMDTNTVSPKDFFIVYIYRIFIMWKINLNDNSIIKEKGIEFLIKNYFRDETRNIGCIFDYAKDRRKIWTIMDRPIICKNCRLKIQNDLLATETFFKDIENELDININPNLSLYKKLNKMQSKYWIIVGILLLIIIPIIIGILTSWLWDDFIYRK